MVGSFRFTDPTSSLQPHHRPLVLRGLLARYFYQSLAVQDHLAVDLTEAGQSSAGFFRHQFGDSNGDDDRVADLDRGAKVQRLRDVDRTGAGQRVPSTAEIRLAV
jgi:hypothetical protein